MGQLPKTFGEFETALKNPSSLLANLTQTLQPAVVQIKKWSDAASASRQALTDEFAYLMGLRGQAQAGRGAHEAAQFNLAQMRAGFAGRTMRPGDSVKLLRRQVGSTISKESGRLANAEMMFNRTGDERWGLVIGDSINKLQQLGNAAARTGTIFDRLNMEQSSRQGKIGNVERFLFAGQEERQNMMRLEFAAKQAIKHGSIGRFNQEGQRAAIAGLRQRGDIIQRGGQFSNKTGDQIADALLAKLGGVDRGPEARNIAVLQHEAANQTILAARALNIAAGALERAAQRAERNADPQQQPVLGQPPMMGPPPQQFQPQPFPHPQFQPNHQQPPAPEVVPPLAQTTQPDEIKVSVNVGGKVQVEGISAEGLGDAITEVAVGAVREHLFVASRSFDDVGPQSLRLS